jgi:hypothetical protein
MTRSPIFTPHAQGSSEGGDVVKDTKKRLDLVPSQRPSVISAPTPLVVDVPHPNPAPSALVEPQVEPAATRSAAIRRSVWVGLAAGMALAVAAGGAVYAADQQAQTARDEALEAHVRVDQATLAAARDGAAERTADQVVAPAVYAASRALATTSAQSTVEHANATLAAVPNAGDAPRAALQTATGAVGSALAAPGISLISLRSLVAGVAAPEKAAVDAQTAWQAAENARVAAEQAAAAEAAAAAAAARAKAPSSNRSSTRSSTPKPAAAADAPAAPATGGVPAGGLVCKGAGGSGAGESSVGAIGAAINAYRASLGLSQLSVSRSGGLVSHAITMANAGGIWHSGADNIVACVSNGSATSMVTAWSHSASHDAQMRRTDVSSMGVGGASLNGYLFGAVKFS